jgi:hypothetical protein
MLFYLFCCCSWPTEKREATVLTGEEGEGVGRGVKTKNQKEKKDAARTSRETQKKKRDKRGHNRHGWNLRDEYVYRQIDRWK